MLPKAPHSECNVKKRERKRKEKNNPNPEAQREPVGEVVEGG
jgi:hypothetical protein